MSLFLLFLNTKIAVETSYENALYHLMGDLIMIIMHFLLFTDLDPCIDVLCDYHGLCKAFGPYDALCVCIDSCPQYQEPVCSSNGTTYDNTCLFKQEMCLLQLNYTVQHPGSCEGIRLLNSYLCSLNPVESGYFLKQFPYEKGVLFHPSGISKGREFYW